MLPIAAVRTGGQVQSLVAGDRALWLSVAEQMARRGAALAVSTGYSLDVRDVRRVCPGAFLLLEDCDGENALPAFDDTGRWRQTVLCSTRRSRRRRSRRRSARGSSG